MTLQDLKAQCLVDQGKYPQYVRLLEQSTLRRAIGKKRKSPRAQLWFNKGDELLAIGENQWRINIGSPQYFVTIYSPHCKCFCLCSISLLEIREQL